MRDGPWRAVLTLALGGLGVGSYLTAASYRVASVAFCEPHPLLSCDAVLASPYARFLGVPVALVGVLGFGALFLAAYGALLRPEEERRGWTQAAALLALAGTAFGLYLTSVEVFVLGVLCPLCLASFLLVLPILALALPAALRRPGSLK